MNKSKLDQIIEEVTARTLVGTVSVSIEKIAEEIAKEALSDEEFRESLHALVRVNMDTQNKIELLISAYTELLNGMPHFDVCLVERCLRHAFISGLQQGLAIAQDVVGKPPVIAPQPPVIAPPQQ
jgi:hypothetical protein